MIDGQPVEIVDAHALFARRQAPPTKRPLCLIHADRDGWMAGFLRPVIEAAGYRCVTRLPTEEQPAMALAMDDAIPPGDLPTIRLRREPTGNADSIYRYDREAVIAALADRIAAGGSR